MPVPAATAASAAGSGQQAPSRSPHRGAAVTAAGGGTRTGGAGSGAATVSATGAAASTGGSGSTAGGSVTVPPARVHQSTTFGELSSGSASRLSSLSAVVKLAIASSSY